MVSSTRVFTTRNRRIRLLICANFIAVIRYSIALSDNIKSPDVQPWAKHQAPNPKLQRSPGIETPKTKLQTPKKSQVPSSKPRPALRASNLKLGASLVFGVWCLELGTWCFFGAWSLEFGAFCPGSLLLKNRDAPLTPQGPFRTSSSSLGCC